MKIDGEIAIEYRALLNFPLTISLISSRRWLCGLGLPRPEPELFILRCKCLYSACNIRVFISRFKCEFVLNGKTKSSQLEFESEIFPFVRCQCTSNTRFVTASMLSNYQLDSNVNVSTFLMHEPSSRVLSDAVEVYPNGVPFGSRSS